MSLLTYGLHLMRVGVVFLKGDTLSSLYKLSNCFKISTQQTWADFLPALMAVSPSALNQQLSSASGMHFSTVCFFSQTVTWLFVTDVNSLVWLIASRGCSTRMRTNTGSVCWINRETRVSAPLKTIQIHRACVCVCFYASLTGRRSTGAFWMPGRRIIDCVYAG